MSKLSFLDKLKVFIDVSKSSYLYMIIIILLLVIGYIFLNTTKKNVKRNKTIYLTVSIFIVVFLVLLYHSSLSKIFDYMMNNFFIAVLFPNLAIYLAALINTNIIVWISLFSFKTSEVIKKLNILIYVIMNYLLALILSIINSNKLDIFTQESVYGNEKARALIELSSQIFIVWIIFLVIYKLILIYLKKDYKPKVRKIIVRKKVKKLPEGFIPKDSPDYIYGVAPKYEKKQVKNQATDIFEKSLTKEDYLLLLKLLKKEKQKRDSVKEDKKLLELQALYRSVK